MYSFEKHTLKGDLDNVFLYFSILRSYSRRKFFLLRHCYFQFTLNLKITVHSLWLVFILFVVSNLIRK